jgi:ElaB/YqjD/DUF883 family membrane-anchored ribosome-binding protein
MSSGTSAPTAQQAGDRAQEVAGQAQEKAQQAANQAKSKVREQVDQRSSDLGQKASSTAEDLRGVAEHLRSQGKDQPAQLAEKAAGRVEGVGSYLQRSDGERILRDAEDFGRQRPWAVVAGGLALGLAASRFLKASSSERYQTYRAPGTSTSFNRPVGQGPATGSSPLAPTITDVPPPGV